MHRAVLQPASCFSSVWDVPCSSLWPPSNLFSSHNLLNHLPGQPSSASKVNQCCFLSLVSYCMWINHEFSDVWELFHRAGGCRQWPGRPASAGLLHLPLSGHLFWPQLCGSRDHFFCELAEEKLRPPSVSWGCKTNTTAAPSSRRCRSHPQMSKTLDAVEAAMVLEKNMNQALLDLLPSLWLPGEPIPRWGGETHQEAGQPPD